MPNKKRILTGHRPTGPRHIGHLVGTLETWAGLQDSHECFFLVADLHVLTTDYHPDHLQDNVRNMLADWLAAGIDPNRSTIVLQSVIPEHAQLALLFGMLTTVARLERVPTYKEQTRELNLKPSAGLLTYPVLQTADILVYKAQVVPVGEDQMPHVELARETARRFNQTFGKTFPEPQALLSEAPRLPGIDNRTMHTSYGNAIYLRDTPEETTRKIMSMYTDPTRLHPTDPGHVQGNPVFALLDAFHKDKVALEDLKTRYQAGKVGDVEVKRLLANSLNAYLAPLRERRAAFYAQPSLLMEILYGGTTRARTIARTTLEEVHEKMGLMHDRALNEKVRSNQSSGAFC
ncbi:MAG TPA: tryptophan--tRNA ligase [Anaerolineales bacterium]